jgi:peptidoglycan/LPS O-acetylase OafA/YrhL
MIVACHYGCAPAALNKLLATDISVMLSKASFIIYLSHMLILRMYFGSQYHLIEVSIGSLTLLIMGLVVCSIVFGVFLCVAFEGPCLKFQRAVLRAIKTPGRKLPLAGSSYHVEMNNNSQLNGHSRTMASSEEKEAFKLSPTSVTLLK